MFDFDPRDQDSRPDERSDFERGHGSRGASSDRDHDARGRDPRDVFTRDLDLPRGHAREIVHDARDRAYTIRGSESRTLSTVGAFRNRNDQTKGNYL